MWRIHALFKLSIFHILPGGSEPHRRNKHLSPMAQRQDSLSTSAEQRTSAGVRANTLLVPPEQDDRSWAKAGGVESFCAPAAAIDAEALCAVLLTIYPLPQRVSKLRSLTLASARFSPFSPQPQHTFKGKSVWAGWGRG